MIKYDFKNKNVIVTGAGKGLGKSISEEFAKAGANVVIADLNKEDSENTANELKKYGVKTQSYILDVSKYEEVEKMINFVVKDFGSIDILINNAGICVSSPIIDMEVKTSDAMVNIDLNGTIYGCKAVLPQMKKQQYGKIVNMSSVAAKVCTPNAAVYSACKAGIIALTTSLAREFAKDNININCILPGIIRTPLWENMLNEMTNNDESKKDEVFASFTKDIPMGRPQEPIDIANMTLFLCSDEANNITGQNIGVDGGQAF
jgi:NAD(P)-dependent dehydrogenase (short-subunit alcohol dehydrogenase family)